MSITNARNTDSFQGLMVCLSVSVRVFYAAAAAAAIRRHVVAAALGSGCPSRLGVRRGRSKGDDGRALRVPQNSKFENTPAHTKHPGYMMIGGAQREGGEAVARPVTSLKARGERWIDKVFNRAEMLSFGARTDGCGSAMTAGSAVFSTAS